MDTVINYLKNPIYCGNRKPKIIYLLFLVFFYIVAVILISMVIAIISKLFHIEHKKIELTPMMKILGGVILAPIYEETLFRSLLKFKKNNIILFISTLLAVIIFLVLKSKIIPVIILSILILSLLSLLIAFSRNKIELFIVSKFKYFFYVTSVSFGLMHAVNFTGNIYIIIAFSFILGGPQIVLGFILGFIRMNFGLFYSIIFHMIVNISILLTLFQA